MIGTQGTITEQSLNAGIMPFPGNLAVRDTGRCFSDTLALPFGVCYNRPVGQFIMTDRCDRT